MTLNNVPWIKFKQKVKEKISEYSLLIIFAFVLIGWLLVHIGILITPGTWQNVFLSLIQLFTALVSFISIFFIFRLDTYHNRIILYETQIENLLQNSGGCFSDGLVKQRKENIQTNIDVIKTNISETKKNFIKFLRTTVPILIISLILLPIGSTIISYNFNIWGYMCIDIQFLYSGIIFVMIGTSILSIYNIVNLLELLLFR
jgi:hypothetical protein